MKTVLQINTSLFANAGQSTALANRFAAAWRQRNPQDRVLVRDLGQEPVPHLDAARFAAFGAQPEQRSPEQQAVVAYSDGLIDELERADVIVLGLPLYNFGVPSQLKAYFDHIARAGVTFRYTENGPVGLLKGKTVYVLAARGGRYAGTELDSQTAYVKAFLGFLGLDDVRFVYAEGLAMGESSKQTALSEAYRSIERLAVVPAAAAA